MSLVLITALWDWRFPCDNTVKAATFIVAAFFPFSVSILSVPNCIFQKNPRLSVFSNQIGFFQPCNVGKGFFRTDGNKVTRRRFPSGKQKEAHFSLSQFFGGQTCIQPEAAIHRKEYTQVLLFFTGRNHQPIHGLPANTASALKPVIQPLTHYLYLAYLLRSQTNLIISFQNNTPPCCILCCSRGHYSYDSSSVIQAKTDSNGVIHHSHLPLVQVPHVFTQTTFIDSTDLFQ